MADDKIKLINRALARLGSAPLGGPAEETPKARSANAIYDDLVDFCFGLHDWTWARRTVALDKETVDPATPIVNGWLYRYDLPDNRLSEPLKVLANPTDPDRPLRRFALEEGKLYADANPVWATFIWRVDPIAWAPVFKTAFLTGLAAGLAIPVAQNTTLQKLYHELAFGTASQDFRGGLIGKAISRDVHGHPGPAPLGLSADPLSAARVEGPWHGDH